ncbi:MAG: hypothetical protein J7J20_07105 [Desulfurococcales archaeon]|nr:hypothetical protein [Desulfurococcales archaeon]
MRAELLTHFEHYSNTRSLLPEELMNPALSNYSAFIDDYGVVYNVLSLS